MSGRRDMDVYPYLLACVVFELCYIECTDEFRMTGNFGRGKVDVYMQRLGEVVVAVGVIEQQIRHDDVSGHFDKTARHEVGILRIVDAGHSGYGTSTAMRSFTA